MLLALLLAAAPGCTDATTCRSECDKKTAASYRVLAEILLEGREGASNEKGGAAAAEQG